jgi:hypothetical protein
MVSCQTNESYEFFVCFCEHEQFYVYETEEKFEQLESKTDNMAKDIELIKKQLFR